MRSLLASLLLTFAACSGNSQPAPAGPDAPMIDPGPPSCRDGVKDNDETDVDCGGACGATCAVGRLCAEHGDCADAGICAELPAKNHEAGLHVCHARVDSCTATACGDARCETMETNLDPTSPTTTIVAYCAPLAKLGAYCEDSGDKDVHPCEAGAACREDPSDPFSYRCVAASTPIGAACSSDGACVDGAYCNFAGGPVVCKPLKARGEACLNTYECGPDLACDDFAGTCQPRGALGASCYAAEGSCLPTEHCAFPTGLACESWGDCGSQMDCCAIAGGSECRPFDGHTHCAPPTGTCAAGAF